MKKEDPVVRQKREKLFEFFDKILDNAETTKQWAYINIYTFFIELMVYKLINFYNNEYKDNFGILESFYSIFEFSNFRKIKKTQNLLYTGYTSFFIGITIFYGVKYVSIQLRMQTRYLKFKWMDSLFNHCVTIYMWFYLIPSLTILGGELFCHDTEILDEATCLVNPARYAVVSVLSFGCLLLIACIVILNSIYNQRGGINKLDYLGRIDQKFELKLSIYIVTVLLAEAVAYKRLSYDVYKLKCALNSIFSLIMYIDTARNFSFMKYKVQELYLTLLGFVVAFDFSTSIPQYFDTERHYFPLWFVILSYFNLKLSKNLVSVISISLIKLNSKLETDDYYSFVAMFPSTPFTKLQNSQLSLSTQEQDKEKLDIRMESIRRQNMDLFDNSDLSTLPLYVNARGIVANHLINCQNIHCFCRTDVVYNPKKKRNILLQLKDTKNSKFFAKFFIKNVLSLNRPDPPYSDSDWNLLYAEYCFKKFNDIFLANFHLKRAEFKNNSYIQKFKIYRLKQKIATFIKPELVGMERDNFVEKVVDLESDLANIKLDMGKILSKSKKFWREFERFEQVSLSSFKKELEEIADKKVEALQRWSNLQNYIQYNPMFNLYYKWYLKDFLNNDVRMTEEEIQLLGELNQNVSLKSMDLVKDLKLDKVVFYKETGIVHLSMQNETIGRIIKVNNGMLTLSKYYRQELVGKNVDKIMPKEIAKSHDKILKNFVRTGGKIYTDGQIQSYMKLKDNTVMRVNIMTKLVFSMISSEIQMVGMIREVNSRAESNNYLLIDEKGNISGATNNFLKETGLVPDHFKSYIFNIVMFCPELRYEISGLNNYEKMIAARRDRKPKKTLIFAKDQASTSSNMLKMMKMNHKLMNKETVSEEESSEDEEIRNSKEYFSGKLKIPLDIKDLLNDYTKTLLNKLSVIKEEDTPSAPSKKTLSSILNKAKKKSLATMFKKKKTNDSENVRNDLIDLMHTKIKADEKLNKTNIFKVTGKVIAKKITVLGEYKVIKLTNFKIKRRKYQPKLLAKKMKESVKVKKNNAAMSSTTSKDDSHDGNFKLRQKLFQRMQTNVNQSLVPTAQIEENSAFLRNMTPSDISNDLHSENSLGGNNPEKMNLLSSGNSKLQGGKSILGRGRTIGDKSNASTSKLSQFDIPLSHVGAGDQVAGVQVINSKRETDFYQVGDGNLNIKISEEDKEYKRQRNDQMILTNYVQVLFKKVENLFTKDDFNKPNDNLKNAIYIKNFLKSMFYLILFVLLFSFVIFKWYIDYRDQTNGLVSTNLVLSYHNATLDSLERYFHLDLYRRDYFGADQQPNDLIIQELYLENSIVSMKNIIFEDNFRNALLFSYESQRKKSIKYDNSSTTLSAKEYTMSLVELSTLYLNKIDLFRTTGETDNLDYFLLENFFKNVNNYILERGEVLYDMKIDQNKTAYDYNFAFFIICCVIYFASFIGIFRLSGIITPCLNAIIVGFNFINEETLRKINLHLNVQISFLNELNLQQSNESINDNTDTIRQMLSTGKSNGSKNKLMNFGNKNRRIKEDNGSGARTFKLSMIFVILMGISLIITSVIFMIDLSSYNQILKFIEIERAVRNEVIALKSSSVTLAAFYDHTDNFEIMKPDLIYQSNLYNQAQIYDIPFESLQASRNSIYHTNTCDLLLNNSMITPSQKDECNSSYRRILANGIKTLREETKSITDEILGVKLNLKNLTIPEYSEFIHAKFYCDKVLEVLTREVESTGRSLMLSFLVLRIILHSVALVLNIFITMSLEKYIGASIGTDYVSIRKIYNHFIPNETLNKEKRLRAYFKKAGILNI